MGEFVNQVGTFMQNKTSEIDGLRKVVNDPNAKDASGNPLADAHRQQMFAQANDIETDVGAGQPGASGLDGADGGGR